ncbi:putative repeat protein (TIGR03943 family) [Microbacterium ginsengiterrae]|uniref:Putative repeat protein (TIGR03943 family) n=1 Tax=Microbacterium ginsengiterrae TaxID=546115 RepID=A0A7W9CCA6_9MICO|nr:TIGR03943 family protein [Microbacterium ginsengiterrae]MBB5742637.1 putative repeat protein (TIGR03943 family) [Microbacterium ginsengiterrae]
MAESHSSSRRSALAVRWLGVGLATVIAVVTLGLGLTGRLTLYISPGSIWFACAGAVVVLIGAVLSFALPLGAESDHGHGHGHEHGADTDEDATSSRRTLTALGTISAGVVASAVVVGALVLPPASLSVELAMSRADATGPLFAGADTPTLGVADTTTFGIGEWSSVFATASRPEAYDGSPVTLVGFVTPSDEGDISLTRMIITHCVIDAQPAAVPVAMDAGDYSADQFGTGQWVEVTGTVKADADGSLRVLPTSVVEIDEPKDPYEY